MLLTILSVIMLIQFLYFGLYKEHTHETLVSGVLLILLYLANLR